MNSRKVHTYFFQKLSDSFRYVECRIEICCLFLININFATHNIGNESEFFRTSIMYNGVGVRTARGTGTSGHVSRNAGALNSRRDDIRRLKELRDRPSVAREIDPSILQHNALRRIEVELIRLHEELEQKGLSESDIETAIEERRVELRSGLSSVPLETNSTKEGKDSHTMLLEQKRRNSHLAAAFGINDREIPVGSSLRELAESEAKAIMQADSVRTRSKSRSPRANQRARSAESSNSSRSRSRSRRY
jgi:serine/arginine repetitive matrix protein 2